MDRIQMRERVASMWKAAREQAGISQAQAALLIGVSKNTIQNWESGMSSPSQAQGFYYFNALGVQAMPFYLKLFYPEEFGEISVETPDELIDKALMTLVSNLPIEEKRKLLFVAYGEHGSSPPAVLDMICAHLHTPLIARIGVAELIRSNFSLSNGAHRITSEKNIMPNMEQLNDAIDAAKVSAIRNAEHYTSISKDNHEKGVC